MLSALTVLVLLAVIGLTVATVLMAPTGPGIVLDTSGYVRLATIVAWLVLVTLLTISAASAPAHKVHHHKRR